MQKIDIEKTAFDYAVGKPAILDLLNNANAQQMMSD